MKSMYASRSVPVLNTPAPNAASVVDCSSQGEELQRKADMANGAVQRVVQRETGVVQREGEANGKFMYVADLKNNPILHENALGNYRLGKNADVENDQFYEKLPYMEGYICFSDYQNGLQSPGFTGCMMMAFHFNLNEENKINDVKRLFKGGILPFYIDSQKPVDVSLKKYVAHVYCEDGNKDTKEALFDAEQRNLITIEALFKPYEPQDGEKIIPAITKNPKIRAHYNQHPEIKTFKGQLTQKGLGQWEADVFTADNVIYGGVKDKYHNYGESGKIKHFNSEDLKFQTLATKALLYASVLVKKALASDVVVDELKEYVVFKVESNRIPRSLKLIKNCDPEAWNNLVRISFCGKEYIKTAIAISSNDNEKLILSLFLK